MKTEFLNLGKPENKCFIDNYLDTYFENVRFSNNFVIILKENLEKVNTSHTFRP